MGNSKIGRNVRVEYFNQGEARLVKMRLKKKRLKKKRRSFKLNVSSEAHRYVGIEAKKAGFTAGEYVDFMVGAAQQGLLIKAYIDSVFSYGSVAGNR